MLHNIKIQENEKISIFRYDCLETFCRKKNLDETLVV